LDTRVSENTKLEGLKVKQNEVIQELSQKEVELRNQIAENKRATDLLNVKEGNDLSVNGRSARNGKRGEKPKEKGWHAKMQKERKRAKRQ
jgi:hypothetical protein